MRHLLLSVLVAASLSAVARADDSALAKANESYQRGDYAAAATNFRQFIDAGHETGDLLFNLGTAELKAGHRGAAMLAFERALRLDPNDSDAAFNLAEAEKGNIDKIVGASDEEPLLERVGARIPTESVGTIFLVAWLLGNLGLIARWFVGRRLTFAAGIGSALVAIALISGPIFFIGAWQRTHSPYAIVVSPSAAVREGPAADFKSAFEVHEGLKVRVLREDRGFLRIRLPNGVEGWLAEKDAPTI
jgi:hypothetical protein